MPTRSIADAGSGDEHGALRPGAGVRLGRADEGLEALRKVADLDPADRFGTRR